MITLSKTALLVLGVIADEPINPYAISRLISFKRKNLRGKIPDPTVYSIINMLLSKKLIKGKKVKNAATPDMTVYSITVKGLTLLKTNLVTYLSTPEDTLSELPLSLFLMGILDKNQVLKALKEYRELQTTEIALMEKMVESEKERGVHYFGILAIEHILQVLKLNLNTINKVAQKVESDTGWTSPQIPFWREEFNHQAQPVKSKLPGPKNSP
jgi:DNA-binding PadR family transcriptional regulator